MFNSVYLVPVTVVWSQVVNQTYNVEKGTTAMIKCNIATRYDYPTWYGPPLTNGVLTVYNFERLSTFLTRLVNYDRLGWGSNNRDLVLSAVARADEGLYQCSAVGEGTWRVQLNIRGRTVGICIFYVFKLH